MAVNRDAGDADARGRDARSTKCGFIRNPMSSPFHVAAFKASRRNRTTLLALLSWQSSVTWPTSSAPFELPCNQRAISLHCALLKDLCAIQGVCGCKPKFGQKKLKKGFFGPKLPFSRTRFFLSDQSLSIDINFSIGFVIAAELEFTIRKLFMVMIMMMMMDPTFAFHRDFL